MQHIMKTIGYSESMIVYCVGYSFTNNIYIRSNPLSCMGIQVALDDELLKMGVLYGVPKSHK